MTTRLTPCPDHCRHSYPFHAPRPVMLRILSKGRTFRIEKSLLESQSSTFKALCGGEFADSESNIIDLTSYHPLSVKVFLHILRTGVYHSIATITKTNREEVAADIIDLFCYFGVKIDRRYYLAKYVKNGEGYIECSHDLIERYNLQDFSDELKTAMKNHMESLFKSGQWKPVSRSSICDVVGFKHENSLDRLYFINGEYYFFTRSTNFDPLSVIDYATTHSIPSSDIYVFCQRNQNLIIDNADKYPEFFFKFVRMYHIRSEGYSLGILVKKSHLISTHIDLFVKCMIDNLVCKGGRWVWFGRRVITFIDYLGQDSIDVLIKMAKISGVNDAANTLIISDLKETRDLTECRAAFMRTFNDWQI